MRKTRSTSCWTIYCVTWDAAENTKDKWVAATRNPVFSAKIISFEQRRRLQRRPRLLSCCLCSSSVCFLALLFFPSFALLLTHHPQALFITLDSGSHDSFVSNLRVVTVGHRRYKHTNSSSHHKRGSTSRKHAMVGTGASLSTIVCHTLFGESNETLTQWTDSNWRQFWKWSMIRIIAELSWSLPRQTDILSGRLSCLWVGALDHKDPHDVHP